MVLGVLIVFCVVVIAFASGLFAKYGYDEYNNDYDNGQAEGEKDARIGAKHYFIAAEEARKKAVEDGEIGYSKTGGNGEYGYRNGYDDGYYGNSNNYKPELKLEALGFELGGAVLAIGTCAVLVVGMCIIIKKELRKE